LVGAFAATVLSVAKGNADDLRISSDGKTVSIFAGNRAVVRYRFSHVSHKPYVEQLSSPSGVQILRDSPSDHKHHHGLMYALAVDGVNFWEEDRPESGREVVRHTKPLALTTADGIQRAGISQDLEWVGPKTDKPLLVERRTINVLESADFGATLIDWRCRLMLPAGKNTAVLGGSDYFGLGIRFLKSMDAGGHFSFAENATGKMVQGTEHLTVARWAAYTAKADGKPVTVAVFDSPTNVRPATMFSLQSPFAYLSATLNQSKQPMTVNDRPLDLCYGIAVWDGEAGSSQIESLYQRWTKLQK
jgi:hypothetical protein